MKDTSLYLEKLGLGNDKKIIFTGSMIPIMGFAASDAGFNIGFAIGLFSSINPGLYLSMNGGIFTPDEIDKNKELFRFE